MSMLFHILALLAIQSILLVALAGDPGGPSVWPHGPFTTGGSSMIRWDGANFTYAGANWPGASETMIPEGLQYQSIETILCRVQSLGMNAIRLTYATQMIDEIYDRDMADVTLQTAFTKALGKKEGKKVYEQVLKNNPSFDENTTRLQVFDAIVAECMKKQIYVHLDNHISRASWCCDPMDGNTWWGDTYFSPTNWTRGLSYMAKHGLKWPNLMSMSLYNELRPPFSSPELMESYNWETWYEQIKRGSRAINEANRDVLIFLSGVNGDTDLQPVAEGTALIPSNATFDRNDFPGYGDKLVLELHSYDILWPVTSCPLYNEGLIDAGFSAVRDDAANRFPVVMSEWGFQQDNSTWRKDGTYAQCVQTFLKDAVPGAGWFVWTIAGSYYIREGEQDTDDTWGLLNHDWSDWRSEEWVVNGLKPMVKSTLCAKTNDLPPRCHGSGNGDDEFYKCMGNPDE